MLENIGERKLLLLEISFGVGISGVQYVRSTVREKEDEKLQSKYVSTRLLKIRYGNHLNQYSPHNDARSTPKES